MPTEMLIRANLAALWDIFVDTNVKSIAYFPVRPKTKPWSTRYFGASILGASPSPRSS